MKLYLVIAVLALAGNAVSAGVMQDSASHLALCGNEVAEARRNDVAKATAFFEKLKSAVAHNDRRAVAGVVRYPLRVNGKYRVANRKSFLNAYDRIFDSKVRTAIQKQRPECISATGRALWPEMAMSGSSTR